MYEWFKSLTGAWGPVLLDWYLANTWINLVVIAYGVLIVLAWRNYDRIEGRLVAELVEKALAKEGKPKLPPTDSVSWENAVAGLRYPFLARRGHFLLRRLSAQAAKEAMNMQLVKTRVQFKLDHRSD